MIGETIIDETFIGETIIGKTILDERTAGNDCEKKFSAELFPGRPSVINGLAH
jgi:hypothetical protein